MDLATTQAVTATVTAATQAVTLKQSDCQTITKAIAQVART